MTATVRLGAAVTGLAAAGAAAAVLVSDLRAVPRRVGPRHRSRTVSVVIPARNEGGAVSDAVRSVLELTGSVGEVIVVDDESTDSTFVTARAAGATALRSGGPPPGWTGKAWACQLGADRSRGDLLLFLDADTRLAPDALDGLLALHDQHGGLVSVQPFHAVQRAYEQVSSYFNVVSLLASAAFGPSHEGRPMAFGPCLITSREDYRLAGGHAAVRGQVLDDIELAHAYHRAGLPVRCAIGGEAIRMRMYPMGVRQLVEGWTKNFASGAAAAPPLPAAVVALWLAAHHAVAAGALVALVRATAEPRWGRLAAWAVGWVGVAWQLRSLLRRIGSFRWWTWALFPAPLAAFDIIFARSVALTLGRRRIRWRGRDVPIAGLRPVRRSV